MVRTWIYNLKREELLQYGSEFKIELTGTVDAMRKEFGEWVEDNEGHAPHAERIDALARKHGRNSPFRIPGIHIENPDVNRTATSLAKMDFASTSEEARRLEDQKREERRAPWGTSSTFPQNQTNTENRTNLERNPVRDYAAVAKQVREWSFKFDGNSKPLEFLEQVEWSAETYGLELDLVPRAMPELLKGTALKWYIANNEHWRTWTSFATSFQEFFLPRDYFSKLLEEVTRRKQGVDELFKRYMVEMQTLMRPLRFSKERERQQIYSCSLHDFRAFARPYQNGSLIELMQLAEEFEELERDRERLRQHTRQNRSRLLAIEDSSPRENNVPCTRCAENDRARPQPMPRAFSGSPTHVDELLAKGCIEPSNSPHSAPIVMVKKKTGKWRLCDDFRQLNNRSVKDAYPLPRVQHILDQLREAHYITSLDLKDGYWQIPMEKASRPLTAFTVPGRGLFQWKVMPFGLHSAPATFQRALDRVIRPEMLPHAFAYLDDIIVIGKTLEEHKNNVKEVFRQM
ncbi:hypothetical protein ACLKA6_004574 [Drosophila palustris]